MSNTSVTSGHGRRRKNIIEKLKSKAAGSTRFDFLFKQNTIITVPIIQIAVDPPGQVPQ